MLLKRTVWEISRKCAAVVKFHWRGLLLSLMVFSLLSGFSVSPLFAVDENTSNQTTDKSIQAQNLSPASIENRFEQIEKTLQSIKVTGEKAEDRSYFNKLASYEVIKYLKLMVLLLVLIALGFPLAIWLLNKSSFSRTSGKSQELAETLLTIEERQAKLANILKEIQGEIDYLHTMSAPDLKNLIQQAESYLKLNESDLQKAGSKQEPDGK
ncbi:MAG: hypothetical protein ACLPVO_10305 [Desulfomonilaceae bacterium]